eukprot:SM000068S20570  [mRNA]  locus=s68:281951:283209:+ [translate_table: standard]
MVAAVSAGSRDAALPKARALVDGSAVVVFSKSYCPYCVRVKKLDIKRLTPNANTTFNPRSTLTLVYSKSYCPYCIRVKKLLKSLGVRATVYELDHEADGAAVQAALAGWTGQRTVPNVFVGGRHIGGCDDTVAAHSSGQLMPLLKQAGAL